MPEITFDGRRVVVPEHTNLVEAGAAAGVPVPVFCYHRSLGAVGACRVCAVTATLKGRARLVMACMTSAADGMEVSTLDPASIEFRRLVLEWLMENHPHDCPICDEGGECQLQDLTVAAGQGHRRFRGPKRTYVNQHLGEFIAHEMNRCITCYRCSRFYQEVAGGRDFGPTGSRDRVYFGRFEPGPLESPFSGNLVELCPTGVFTDKLFRYRARVWDLEQAPSICPHCSVGCNLRPGSRHRELMRVRVRENEAVNGTFLCDRGQFGFGWVEDAARPRAVRLRGAEATWEDALGIAGAGLLAIARAHGPESVALLASPRAALETHAALHALAAGPLAGARVAHFDDPGREARAVAQLAALARARAGALDQAALADCDVLLVAGPSLVDEAPLAALAARTVARRGGRLFVVNAGERFLGEDAAAVIPIHPARLAETISGLAAGGGDGALGRLAAALRGARAPGVISGGDLVDGTTIAAAADLTEALGSAARLGYVFPGPDGFGAAAISGGVRLPALLEALRAGRVRAAVVVESDLDRLGPALVRALAGLELLVVLDHVPGPLADAAHVLLPATTSYESAGIFVNRAGRAQAFAAADVPGEPVRRLVEGAAFPRQPRVRPPLADVRPSWWALEQLRAAAGGPPAARDLRRLRGDLARSHPLWRPIDGLEPGTEGAPLDPALLTLDAPHAEPRAPSRGLSLYSRDRTLGSESLSRRSEPMRVMAGPPLAWLSPADARRLGVDGTIAIACGDEMVELGSRVLDSVPEGVVLVPRDAPWSVPPPDGAEARVTAVAGARGGPR